MTSTNVQAATRQSRREALKRFGRYAAAAPTTMLLLEPREGHAGRGNRRGGGKGGKGRKWVSGGTSGY
jgi:hypothetical protein